MKLFPEFRSCWGGAPINPAAAADAATDERHTAERSNRRLVKVRSATHWKPKLNAISESSPMTEVNRRGGNARPTGIGNKKAAKVKPRFPAKSDPAEDYYWKTAQAMAIPAFAPTSFLF